MTDDTEEMTEKIVKRLGELGIDIQNSDREKILTEYEKVFSFIKASCSTEKISESLEHVIIERTCGNYLFFMKNTGRFTEIEDAFVKEIEEGDVKVVFDENSVMSAEQRADRIIDYLMGYGMDVIMSSRSICWYSY